MFFRESGMLPANWTDPALFTPLLRGILYPPHQMPTGIAIPSNGHTMIFVTRISGRIPEEDRDPGRPCTCTVHAIYGESRQKIS